MSLLCIADLLAPEACSTLCERLRQLPQRDGRATAGWSAEGVKRNLQFEPGDPRLHALQDEVERALSSHPMLRSFARPARMTRPMFNLYRAGMRYGRHVDDALMGDPPLRTDLAFTLFLSAPEAYDGGELQLLGNAGTLPVKLAAGALVLYGAGKLHQVSEVTRGERFAAVGWIQSLIRDAERREVLFDLDRTRRTLFEREGDSDEFAALSRCSNALLRMWSEP